MSGNPVLDPSPPALDELVAIEVPDDTPPTHEPNGDIPGESETVDVSGQDVEDYTAFCFAVFSEGLAFLNLPEASHQKVAGAYGALLAKWDEKGYFAKYGLEINAAFLTIMVYGPAIKKYRKRGKKPDGKKENGQSEDPKKSSQAKAGEAADGVTRPPSKFVNQE